MSVATRFRSARPAATASVAVEQVARADAPPLIYVGLVTRCLAFGVDGAIINGIALIVGAIGALAFSVMSLPSWLKAAAIAVGGVAYVLWAMGYFITFWCTTGQTPGNRVMRIRVQARDGVRLLPRRALLRLIGLWLAAIPLFAGILLILVENRRRGLHDILARTVVVEAPPEVELPAPGPWSTRARGGA